MECIGASASSVRPTVWLLARTSSSVCYTSRGNNKLNCCISHSFVFEGMQERCFEVLHDAQDEVFLPWM